MNDVYNPGRGSRLDAATDGVFGPWHYDKTELFLRASSTYSPETGITLKPDEHSQAQWSCWVSELVDELGYPVDKVMALRDLVAENLVKVIEFGKDLDIVFPDE